MTQAAEKKDSIEHIWSVISHDLKGSTVVMRSNLQYLNNQMIPLLLDVYHKAQAAGLDIPSIRADHLALYHDTVPAIQTVLERMKQYVARLDRKLCPHYFRSVSCAISIQNCIHKAITQYQARYSLVDKSRICIELEEAMVLADEENLCYIVYELLDNAEYAIKAGDSPHEGGVWIQGVKNKDYYQLEVKNNGLCLSEKTLTQVFEPYFSTNPSAIGLGLSFCREALHEMQGQIYGSLENPDHTDWVLRFTLPQTS